MADVTRLEQFLNHIAHPDEPAPTPKTREEYILKEIAENKGGGGGSGTLQLVSFGILDEPIYYDVVGASEGTHLTPAPVSEIKAAYEAGKTVLLRLPTYYAVVPLLNIADGDNPVFGYATNLDDEDMGRYRIFIGAPKIMQDDWTYDYPVWAFQGFDPMTQFYAPLDEP